MLAKKLSDSLRTWLEIDSRAAKHNCKTFRGIIGPRVKLWAVVKSNAYGHGLVSFSKLAETSGVDGFCVDSIVEGLRLRDEGIRKQILVLGPTLPSRLIEAAADDVTVSVSSFDALKAIARAKSAPRFHLKIDTGFHRQGFYPEDVPKAIKLITNYQLPITGVYTHFSVAKDIVYPTYTELQFAKFQKAVTLFRKAGYKNLTVHAAATGGAMMNKKYHLDAVRIGVGLYGYHASPELELQFENVKLKSILSWRTVISDIKKIKRGAYIGYDLAERAHANTKVAILPVGYWHGFSRSLSHIGEVLIAGRRARVVGRVSMDLTIVDVGGIRCGVEDAATLIGRDGSEEISAAEIAQRSGTTHYEFLTRLNPLMERVVV